MTDETAASRALAVVQALHVRTREGKVEWSETETEDVFRAESGGFELRIREAPDRDYPGEPDYFLEVRRLEDGRLVETISNISLRPVMDRTMEQGLNPYGVLQSVYEHARRRAVGADDALDSILKELEGGAG